MKRIIIPVLILISITSCTHKNNATQAGSTQATDSLSEANAPDETNIISVKVVSVSPEPFMDSISATGLVTTENEANLSFKIGGVIDRIYVNEGQTVSQGELLASLKVTEINTQLDQANLALDKAQRDYTRASNLFKDSVGTLEQLQNAKTALDIAKQSVDAISFNHQFAFIKAGAGGFVSSKVANEGEVIAPGAPVLMINETGGNKDWVLRVGVTDAEWSSIYLGQKATIRLDAFPGEAFTGKVYRKSQSADPASGSFQVDIQINIKRGALAAGMFGRAVLVPEKAITENTLPYEALIQINGKNGFVYTPGPDGSLKRVNVVIKSFNEKGVIIGSGLSEGEQVVVSNNAFLNEKSKIAIAK
jgi:RND family efflux transporter MFP subunit